MIKTPTMIIRVFLITENIWAPNMTWVNNSRFVNSILCRCYSAPLMRVRAGIAPVCFQPFPQFERAAGFTGFTLTPLTPRTRPRQPRTPPSANRVAATYWSRTTSPVIGRCPLHLCLWLAACYHPPDCSEFCFCFFSRFFWLLSAEAVCWQRLSADYWLPALLLLSPPGVWTVARSGLNFLTLSFTPERCCQVSPLPCPAPAAVRQLSAADVVKLRADLWSVDNSTRCCQVRSRSCEPSFWTRPAAVCVLLWRCRLVYLRS